MATKKDFDDEFMDMAEFERKIEGKPEKTDAVLVQESMKAEAEIQNKVNRLRVSLQKEPKTKIRISPAYKPYLGSRCQIQINGIPIVVPVDGSMIEIPESYAAELYRRMAGVDKMLDQQVKMANYSQNRESVIGEIKF